MSSPIPEHENSRFWLFRDKFFIVEAVLNIIIQATAFASLFFYIKVKKMKEQLVTWKLFFFNHPNIYIYTGYGAYIVHGLRHLKNKYRLYWPGYTVYTVFRPCNSQYPYTVYRPSAHSFNRI